MHGLAICQPRRPFRLSEKFARCFATNRSGPGILDHPLRSLRRGARPEPRGAPRPSVRVRHCGVDLRSLPAFPAPRCGAQETTGHPGRSCPPTGRALFRARLAGSLGNARVSADIVTAQARALRTLRANAARLSVEQIGDAVGELPLREHFCAATERRSEKAPSLQDDLRAP